jgi:hypothetical protein
MTSAPVSKIWTIPRRRFVLALGTSFGLGALSVLWGRRLLNHFLGSPFAPFWPVLDQVVPPGGIKTSVSFSDSIQRLIAAGALDPHKLRAKYFRYRSSSQMPGWLDGLLTASSSDPIDFSIETAPHLINLLWPLGLSTRLQLNEKSPINTASLASLASTGGWTLGREPNGAAYFNKVASMAISQEQEQRVYEVATTTFRPCCDNSTFFQDCNHGSALLGLLELGAAQGKSVDELYRLALAANAYWFPEQYVKTALYFALFEGTDWSRLDPRRVLGPRFSSLSGWQGNVNGPIQFASFLSNTTRMTQRSCGV